MKLEVRRIGNSTGLILPKELMAKLDLKQGQWLYVTELPDSPIRELGHVKPLTLLEIELGHKLLRQNEAGGVTDSPDFELHDSLQDCVIQMYNAILAEIGRQCREKSGAAQAAF